MKRKFTLLFVLIAAAMLGSFSAQGFIPGDTDGDGVPDTSDACVTEDASFFDRDGDGCIDPFVSARHTEYWGAADDVITYLINDQGAPNIGDGSDFVAIQDAVDAWTSIPGVEFNVTYGGTTPQQVADGLDQVNLVTFVDDEFPFPSAVLAVGISTSFTSDSLFNGRLYRPGEIVDSDMIFNPTKTFVTSLGGGTDLQATATHEAGHLWGLSHSPVPTSTMFFVLPPSTQARTLEAEDISLFRRSYPDSALIANASMLRGTITDGLTSEPVPGAAVFVIDAVAGDTVAADYSMPDGSFMFPGLAAGSYNVAIHPLNGTAAIGFLLPGYINALVDTTAQTLFVPEFYDANESAVDNSEDATPVLVVDGGETIADIITNIDNVPPAVTEVIPTNGSTNIGVQSALIIRFSESIDINTIAGNFSVTPSIGPSVPGAATILDDDSVIVFTPASVLTYSETYTITLNTGLSDLFGNGLASDFTSTFTTEPVPPLAITSLSPAKGVPQSTVVINGVGFDANLINNTVTFDDDTAQVLGVTRNSLVVRVPENASTGDVQVFTLAETSNAVPFTVLTAIDIAAGTQIGVVNLQSSPKAVVSQPSGDYAYVATRNGFEAVSTDDTVAEFLTVDPIDVNGGLNDLSPTPNGRRIWGIGRANQVIHVIDSDPADGALFNTVLATLPVGDEPLGIQVDPTGSRAYVPTAGGVIQVWDANTGSASFQQRLKVIVPPDPIIRGKLSFTPDGERFVGITGNGNVLVFDAVADTAIATITVGGDLVDVIVDPAGARAYASDINGNIKVVSLNNGGFYVQDIPTGGGPQGLSLSPGGQYLYAANRELDGVNVIDLIESSPSFRSVVATSAAADPNDVVVGADGVYNFVTSDPAGGPKQLLVNTLGSAVTLKGVTPTNVIPGGVVTVRGNGLTVGGVSRAPELTLILPDQSEVSFSDFFGNSAYLTMPDGLASGPIKVRREDVDNPTPFLSNEVFLNVLPKEATGNVQPADTISASPLATQLTRHIAVSPKGDLVAVIGFNGILTLVGTDPERPDFHQVVAVIDVHDGPNGSRDMLFTPDGKLLFVCVSGDEGGDGGGVVILNTDTNSPDFGKPDGFIDTSFTETPLTNPSQLAISPSGLEMWIYDFAFAGMIRVDLESLSTTDSFLSGGVVNEMVYHPDGQTIYLLQSGNEQVQVFDNDPFSATYQQVVANILFQPGEVPLGLDVSPEGDLLVVQTHPAPSSSRTLYMYTLADPHNPIIAADGVSISGASTGVLEQVRFNPRGRNLMVETLDIGFQLFEYIAGQGPVLDFQNSTFDTYNLNLTDFGFSPDGSRAYAVNRLLNRVEVLDFSLGGRQIYNIAGYEQSGVINTVLPQDIVFQVSTGDPIENNEEASPNVLVRFSVPEGGGGFVVDNTVVDEWVGITDESGQIGVTWKLGPVVGAQNIRASVLGAITDSEVYAEAFDEPENLPLTVNGFAPFSGSTNVSATTAVQAVFSRPVNPSTITSSSFQLIGPSGQVLDGTIGFANNNQSVSITPREPLSYDGTHTVAITTDVEDAAGGPLTQPFNASFTTQSPPALTVAAVSPPSGIPNITLTISGSGFGTAPTENTVLFNDVAVAADESGIDFIRVDVPNNFPPGQVALRVVANGDTSSALAFNALEVNTSPIDEVISSVGTGASTKSVAITADGTLAYSISPESDVVIPIDMEGFQSFDPVTVGDNPLAVVIEPASKLVYVANFGSNTVSVIDADSTSAMFNRVVSTIVVGANPIDLVAAPDGDRVYVANAGSQDVSVLDSDESSATFNTVVSSVGTGQSTKGVTISVDGTVLYVGTDTGFLVIDTGTEAVVSSVGTGKSTKSVTISVDGTLLYVLTTEGEVLIIDNDPNSSSYFSVVSRVGTGSKTKEITISPDGTLLYLVQEDSDDVIVVSVEVTGGAASFDDYDIPPPGIGIAFVDTIPTGDDPAGAAVDPRGTGRWVVCNAGESTIFVYDTEQPDKIDYLAEVTVKPSTIKLPIDPTGACEEDDKDDELDDWWDTYRGRYIRAWIELPDTGLVELIDTTSVLLNDVIPGMKALKKPFTDRDKDGLPEAVYWFDRELFEMIIPQGDYVKATVSGMLITGDCFEGCDSIRTHRPEITAPTEGQTLVANEVFTIRWTSPSDVKVDYVDIFYTLDDGTTWLPIAEMLTDDDGEYDWIVPLVVSDCVRIMVTLYEDDYKECTVVGQGMSAKFDISIPLAVRVTSFSGKVEDGKAMIRWETGTEIGAAGFHLRRSNAEDGVFHRVSTATTPATGGVSGERYEWVDDTGKPGQTYYYMLEEITDRGGSEFYGPYEVTFKASYELRQNVPNPFNPTTTIRFVVPERADVSLVIYDVQGRVVRTLMEGNQEPNFYSLIWDGRNNNGQSVASGVYFYRLRAGQFVRTKKMMLLK